MKKTPTLFQRDPVNRSRVTDQVTPGCEWVLAGEGIPTRKFDGTCVMFDGMYWWARREYKPGKTIPVATDVNLLPTWKLTEFDPVTGKSVGWEPIAQSSFFKFMEEALRGMGPFTPGTYELIGPKINGNPEGWDGHALLRHGSFELPIKPPTSFDEVRRVVETFTYEGIVWHHPDGRMAKIKRRDFGAHR